MKDPEQANPESQSRLAVAGSWAREKQEVAANVPQDFLEGDSSWTVAVIATKVTELYTLKGCTPCYVNYIALLLLKFPYVRFLQNNVP